MMRVPKVFALVFTLSAAGALTAQAVYGSGLDAQQAIASGKITAEFVGTGGSSGDSIKVRLAKTPKAGPGPLEIDIPPGTILQSSDSEVQNMMVAGVRGIELREGSFRATSSIILTGTRPVTYVLSAFCAEFEKGNPSPATTFSLAAADPDLACITRRSLALSVPAKQAAVWIHTDDLTFDHMNQKFSVSAQEWATAQGLVTACGAHRMTSGLKATQPPLAPQGPSLDETLKWLVEKISSSGAEKLLDGGDLRSFQSVSDVSTRGCTLFMTMHDEVDHDDGALYSGIDDTISISLSEIHAVNVFGPYPSGAFGASISGLIKIIKESKRAGDPRPPLILTVFANRAGVTLQFDRNTADRVANGLRHAIELCSAQSAKEPF